MPFSELGRPGFRQRAVLYVNAACSFAEALGIPDIPVGRISSNANEDDLTSELLKLEDFMDQVQARNLFALDSNLRDASVGLDQDWKSRATTLVGHIREIVSKATMSEDLRAPIMTSLNRLQDEIDRNRTRIEAVSKLWLDLTTTIGKGAENLENAVKLVERLAKAFGTAKRHEIEAVDHPKLPPPDDLDVED